MSHHIVEAETLSYAYPDGNAALREVSFRITHGESTALLGANGAGKSTLLMQLSGCLFPSAGTVRIGTVALTPKSAPHIRRAVGMVFQDPDDQLFMPTVLEDTAFGPLNLGMSMADATRRAEEALDRVGCLHLKHRAPYKLSGGEKRAVSIATVLALSPDVLVMDEPSSNLDAPSRRRLISLLQSFSHTRIIATHDLEMALEVCERAIVMKNGRVVADGPIRSLLLQDQLSAEWGLERPQSLKPCPRCGKVAEE